MMKKIRPKNNNQRAIMANNNAPVYQKALLGLVMCSVCVIVDATDNIANTNSSYTIRIVEKQVITKALPTVVKAKVKPVVKNIIATEPSLITQAKTKVELVDSTSVSEEPVDSVTDSRSIRLDEGGVIWVTNDPVSLTPLLDVTTSKEVKWAGKEFESPISFTLNTNYAAFIDNWELVIYRGSDDDERTPLKTFHGSNLTNGEQIKWPGDIRSGEKLDAGDSLKYTLTVRNKLGNSDQTRSRLLTLKGPGRNIKTENEIDTDPTIQNNLKRQTIPLYGSRVRIYGNDIFDGNKINIDGENISVRENRFVVEKLLPEGAHDFDIKISKTDNTSYNKRLNTKVDGKYMFMIGLADLTVGEGKVSDNLVSLSDGDRYLDGDIFIDGRLAFYLKGKIKGKYLVTAQMDTGTDDIEDLFDNIHKKDAQSIFRRLDPDKYYPVYGDDSTIIDDSDSQGKIYARVDWDKSTALWGNFNTDMNGTELSSFNRSLYGAKFVHKSNNVTKDGDHKTDFTVFASEAQSAFRHNQFLGTGGSLYYLKDSDIVVGSEKVWIEVRDPNNERPVNKIVMQEGRDYEIDDFQGRIILYRPLLQIAEQSNPSLIKDNPLNGDQVYLMVDYEYVPDAFESDKASFGARGKQWLNEHFAIGGSYAHENRNDNDYNLKGVDLTLKKSKGTYFVAEYAESESLQTAGSFASLDGGLNFNDLISETSLDNKEGSAYSFEARANLEDFSGSKGALIAWYNRRDAGFSSTHLQQSTDTIAVGVEANIDVNKNLTLSTRSTILDKKELSKVTTASIQADYNLGNKFSIGAEVRHIKEENQSLLTDNSSNAIDGEGTLAAFKVGYDLNSDVNLYTITQSTLDKKGSYTSNDLFTIGTKAKLSNELSINGELSTGDRGEAAVIGLDYKLNDTHNLYTNYTLSTDSTDNKRNLFTVGQRKSVSNRLNVFTEHQFIHEDQQSGLGHTFGLDYNYTDNVTLSTSVQTARLDNEDGDITNRDAFSVGLSYDKDKSTGSSRLEYRRDKGGDNSPDPKETEQWVSTNRLNYRVNPSLRLQAKLNYSITNDKLGNTKDATFTEAGLGFAYRPTHNDRLNILGRLNYLYDLQPLAQSNNPDEKSLTASIEGTYQLDQKWQVGGKVAHKLGEIRSNRDTGKWEQNDATLVAARLRYHLTHNWDALAQYHWLNSEESQDTQHGAMLSVDRHIGKNLKIGIGYNFTNFDDDLSNTSEDAKGWFINLVGKF